MQIIYMTFLPPLWILVLSFTQLTCRSLIANKEIPLQELHCMNKWCRSISQGGPRQPRGSTSQGQSRSRGHSSPFLSHKLPGMHCFDNPFWRIKPGDDWASPTLLDSLTCLLSQGEKYFALCIKHFAGEDHLSTYRRFGSRKPGFLFCHISFGSTWFRADFLAWIDY